MVAHMAEGGSAYIFHADTEGLNFRKAFKEAGFHISGVCNQFYYAQGTDQRTNLFVDRFQSTASVRMINSEERRYAGWLREAENPSLPH